MRGLTDRCIIVTGGASGIGRAIAVRLAAEGAALGIWDINADAAQQTAQAIQTAGGRAEAFSVDITDHAQVRAHVAGFLTPHLGAPDKQWELVNIPPVRVFTWVKR